LTDNVSLLANNLTAQVRSIADVTSSIVLPILFEGQLKAVIELASFQRV
jgi:hypothetical protein